MSVYIVNISGNAQALLVHQYNTATQRYYTAKRAAFASSLFVIFASIACAIWASVWAVAVLIPTLIVALRSNRVAARAASEARDLLARLERFGVVMQSDPTH